MNYGVLGTGNVAQTIASKLIELGHHVMMGSRTAQNEKAVKWVSENGSRAECGTFADAAAFGERVFNCVQGIHAIEVLQHLGELLKGKSVMMTNPNELSEPATGFYCGNDSNAKDAVREILHDFGWTDTFDMGDISMSRYTEMLGAFWVPVFGQLNTMHWGFRLVR